MKGVKGVATLAAAVRRAARPELTALVAPQQGVDLVYGELDLRVRSLANGLSELGVKRGDAVVTDFPNTAENLISQLALSHLGAAVASAKDAAAVAKLQEARPVVAALCATKQSALAQLPLRLPAVILSGEPVELWTGGVHGASLPYDELASCTPDEADPEEDEAALHGSFSGSALTNAQVSVTSAPPLVLLSLVCASVLWAIRALPVPAAARAG